MAFPVVAGSASNFDNSAPRTVTLPASIAADELIISAVQYVLGATPSTPAGYSVLVAGAITSEVGLVVYWKKAAGGETSFDPNLGAHFLNAISVRITGWDGVTTPEAAVASATASTPPNPPSLTPSWGSADTLWLAIGAMQADPTAGFTGVPTNYTSVVTSQTGSEYCGISMGRRDLAASSEDPGAFSDSVTVEAWRAVTIAVRPAASGLLVTQTDNFDSSSSGTTFNFNAQSIGADGGNDVLYIPVGSRGVSGPMNAALTTLTVDGVSADLITSDSIGAATENAIALFAINRNDLPDPSQTDVDIVVTWPVSVLRMAGILNVGQGTSKTAIDSNTDKDSGTIGTTTTQSLNCNTEADGIAIGFAFCGHTGNGVSSHNWTGLTEDGESLITGAPNTNYSGATADATAAATPRTISVEFAKGGNDLADPISLAATFGAPAGGSAYEIDADVGAYTLTGVDTLRKLSMGAGVGSYALSGQDAGLSRNVPLTAAVGTYALTGNAASTLRQLLLACATGTYDLVGQDAAGDVTLQLAADVGAYVLSGQDTTGDATYRLSAEVGGYTLSGVAASLLHGYTLPAGAGSFALTGNDVAFLRGYNLVGGAGSYELTGQEVDDAFEAFSMTADQGAYNIIGVDVTLRKQARRLWVLQSAAESTWDEEAPRARRNVH